MKLIYYSYGSRAENKIALTFDDGPNPFFTEKVLSILDEHKIRATFFLIGKRAALYPHLVQKIFSEGHLIGNHTYSHSKGDFQKGGTVIKETINEFPCYIRAPYLDLSFCFSLSPKYLKQVKIISFDLDSFDWKSFRTNEIINRVKILVRNGSIINFHDGSENENELQNRPLQMVKALPSIIKNLKRKYKLVRVNEIGLIPQTASSNTKVMPKYPNVTQKVIFRCKNKILILRHPNGILDFPGGRIEFGESLLSGLNRELNEELNYTLPELPKLFDVWNYISRDRTRHSVFIYYLCELKKQSRFHSPEKLESLWLTKQDMKKIGLIKEEKFLEKMFSRMVHPFLKLKNTSK